MIFRSRKRRKDDFHQEVMPHLDALYYYARYLTKDVRDAEDLVQETFTKAFRFFHRYKVGTNAKAWLFRIMMNTHINRQRGKKRQFSFLDNVDVGESEELKISDNSSYYRDPETQYVDNLLHDEVKRALESIPEDFRVAVVLSDLQDFSYKEIAEIMDCPIGTVMSRLHRGRKMLQKKLRAYATERGILPKNESGEAGEKPTSLADYRAKRSASA